MTHDPLCPAKNYPGANCHSCHLIDEARRDMLAKCITAVDTRIRPTLHPLENAGIGEALSALRDLQEKP
jgi:hypothetical protein